MSDNSDTPKHTLQYPHPGNIGHVLTGVTMTGELGKGAVALRDIVFTGMVVAANRCY